MYRKIRCCRSVQCENQILSAVAYNTEPYHERAMGIVISKYIKLDGRGVPPLWIILVNSFYVLLQCALTPFVLHTKDYHATRQTSNGLTTKTCLQVTQEVLFYTAHTVASGCYGTPQILILHFINFRENQE